MKSTLLLAAAALLFSSCDTDLLSVDQDFTGATITMTIPASPTGGSIVVQQPDVVLDLQARVEEYGLTTDNLRSVSISAVRGTIKDPAGELTFDDLSDISFSLSSEALPDVRIAELVEGTGTTVDFTVQDVDVKDYLLAAQFGSVLAGVCSEGIGEEVTVEVDVTYVVTGGL